MTLIGTVQSPNERSWMEYSVSFHPEFNNYQILIRGAVKTNNASTIQINSIAIIPQEINCYTENGQYYRGQNHQTIDGYECKDWQSQRSIPHVSAMKRSKDDLTSNYCRNPGSYRSRPWCYTTNPNAQWHYCNIPKCVESVNNSYTYALGNKYPVQIVNKDENSANSGLLTLFANGQWGTVCGDRLSVHAASAICKQTNKGNYGYITRGSFTGKDKVLVRGSDIKCNPNAAGLQDCTVYANPSTQQCSHNKDIWITCSRDQNSRTGGFGVELVDSSSPSQGEIRVIRNNVAIPVCYSNLSIVEADVICRQLGYTTAGGIQTYHPILDATVWVTYFKCKGYESSINDCVIEVTDLNRPCSLSSRRTFARCYGGQPSNGRFYVRYRTQDTTETLFLFNGQNFPTNTIAPTARNTSNSSADPTTPPQALYKWINITTISIPVINFKIEFEAQLNSPDIHVSEVVAISTFEVQGVAAYVKPGLISLVGVGFAGGAIMLSLISIVTYLICKAKHNRLNRYVVYARFPIKTVTKDGHTQEAANAFRDE
ncbi:uncharacterized protein TRIADDRAFT_51904 [Trichoplax adhaerens]|uniref:Kringle domain-containing protein n=1 Tax=Trichoplax adhaerens TaxID=10228 RepID=B3RL75_TRIAD|nr:hypothetical protein TRIADDRAFT_51904 [Trichoplax adhaerens]EDV28713.1 hypothetical protein TRIADDRAFT_51904 [Trichoplax adhaerens]|eukprot:XP_002107915.1 hypothetical protein TRIADDRAFT_51904 [Trichoplax adhaerens]